MTVRNKRWPSDVRVATFACRNFRCPLKHAQQPSVLCGRGVRNIGLVALLALTWHIKTVAVSPGEMRGSTAIAGVQPFSETTTRPIFMNFL